MADENANETCSAMTWRILYGNPYLLGVQSVLTLVAAVVCGYLTRDESEGYRKAYWGCVAVACLYAVLVSYAFSKKERFKTWRTEIAQRYWVPVLLFPLRCLAAIGLLRLFVFISASIEKGNVLDGYSTAVYLLCYVHVCSVVKLFSVEDALFLSDSLLAICIMIAARLDHVSSAEEVCHIQAKVNTTATLQTVPIFNGSILNITGTTVTFEINTTAGFLHHIARTICSYVFAAIALAFRISKIPYGNENNNNDKKGTNDEEMTAQNEVTGEEEA